MEGFFLVTQQMVDKSLLLVDWYDTFFFVNIANLFVSYSRTESISSEEEEDWPTSPIIPIFEQC